MMQRLAVGLLLVYALALTPLPACAFPASWNLSPADMSAAQNASLFAGKGRWDDALAYARKARDPLLYDIFLWKKYTAGSPSTNFSEITQFLIRRPGWPRQDLMIQRVEEAMGHATPASAILQWFRDPKRSSDKKFVFREPVSAKGKWMLAEALLRSMDETGKIEPEITRLLREAWVDHNFTPKAEDEFLQRYRDRLRQKDFIARTDRLVWDGHYNNARRQFGRIPAEYQKLFNARILLRTDGKGVERAVAQVPRSLQGQDGYVFDRIRYREKKQITQDMSQLLRTIPTTKSRPTAYWGMLQKYIQAMQQAGEYDLAYHLAANHGFTDGSEGMIEAEWSAGWISLRFLKKPRLA